MKKINIAKLLVGITWICLVIIGISKNLSGFLMVLFLSSVILGPFFCGWLCPFGFIQDITSKLAKKTKLPQIKIPKRIHNVLKYLKYLLFILLLLPISSFLLGVLKYDPRSNLEILLQNKTFTIASIVAIVLFLIVSLFNSRFFCKYLCVEGAKYSVFSFSRLFNINRTSSCVECGKCTESCPMQIDIQKQKEVTDMTCINCMDCITSCNVKNAISYKPTTNVKKILILCLSTILVVGYMIYTTNSKNNILSSDSGVQTDSTSVESQEDIVLTGSAQGFISTITVEVTMSGDTILDISVIDHQDDIQWFTQAMDVIDSIIDSQSTDVDTISGATYSSKGIIDATKDALGQDTNDASQQTEVIEEETSSNDSTSENENQVSSESADGDGEVLTGSANGYKGTVTVEVTMNDDSITDIQVIDHQDDEQWFDMAMSVITDILQSQSTDVDTVSGATYSSQGIINATKDALGEEFTEQESGGGHHHGDGEGRGAPDSH